MILLTQTTDKIQLVTSAACNVDVLAFYVERNQSTGAVGADGRQATNILTATTTDIVAVPGASTTRNVKELHIRNKHATATYDVTVQLNANGTIYELYKVTLRAGDSLEYNESYGFYPVSANLANLTLTSAEPSSGQTVLTSTLNGAAVGTFVTINGTAYYLYLGRIARDLTVTFAEFYVTTAGAGAQTAEIGLFSTPTPPSKAGQTLTKIVATGTVDAVTATGVKRNTSSFAQLISAGTHLWAGIRFAMATTQPTCAGRAGDMSQGHVLTTTGGGALTGLSTASGTIPAIATATVTPDVRVVVG